MAEEINPTPPSAPAATPATEPVQSASGTVNNSQPVSEAPATQGQAAPDTDAFTQVDVNSLSPSDRSAYENMLRDYKRKTQDLAELRRQYETAYLNLQQTQQPASAQPDQPAIDPNDPYLAPIAQEMNQLKENLQRTKADLFLKDYKSRPDRADFDELDADGLITGYIQLNPPKSEKEWQRKMDEAYEYVKKVTSRYEEKGWKRGLSRVQEKAAQSTELPGNSPAQGYSGDPTKLTTQEAWELAKKGQRVR